MAKIRKPTAANLSALTSDVVATKKYRNRVVFERVRFPKPSKSEKRQDAIERFREANEYAKNILKKPGMREFYLKGLTEKKRSAHAVAVSDYLNAPVIHGINTKAYRGVVGDKLRIKVTDDFQVTAVEVRIRSRSGKLLEQGAAERYKRKPFIWIYTATVANPSPEGARIGVTAMDRPGNSTKQELTIGAQTNG